MQQSLLPATAMSGLQARGRLHMEGHHSVGPHPFLADSVASFGSQSRSEFSVFPSCQLLCMREPHHPISIGDGTSPPWECFRRAASPPASAARVTGRPPAQAAGPSLLGFALPQGTPLLAISCLHTPPAPPAPPFLFPTPPRWLLTLPVRASCQGPQELMPLPLLLPSLPLSHPLPLSFQ